MAFAVIATITNVGRQRMAQALATGKSFAVDKFSLGQGGHDALDPSIALTPDPTAVTCPSTVFGPKAVTSSSLVSPFCPEFVCDLSESEAVSPLSNICMIGTIVYSPVPGDPELGTEFLFAQGNFPLRVKLDTELLTFTVTIQF